MKRKLNIYQGRAGKGAYETYEVDLPKEATLLDALEYLRTGAVPDLAYRHSCHHGSCGTCTVRVNGKEILACLTPLESLYDPEKDAAPRIDPPAVFETVRDLAADPGILFRSIPEGIGYLRKSEWVSGEAGPDSGPAPEQSGGDQAGPVRFEDCIECGACVSACPVLREWGGKGKSSQPFMGPAALAALRRETINNPEGKAGLMLRAAEKDGVAACKRYIECSRVCPRKVYPAKHIEILRRELNPPE
ncbi:2Fe-2S iron-sulfur cluster-binding protein [Breznakiella homolactica]|uniref:Fumarate reductase iron-sulfur subunit n=1 Tax=Breznakiella homolactica TaxID=2798577 RepID=A0A7T7XN59_9SPIR|nr:2Fe-2S iron-sulfur cluster-binding protein [Breznakiella homolactica]QQO09430.1 2Fe-2S iron-sulfur cluster binding domain-containing protein [Breznakiella homolactica]